MHRQEPAIVTLNTMMMDILTLVCHLTAIFPVILVQELHQINVLIVILTILEFSPHPIIHAFVCPDILSPLPLLQCAVNVMIIA
jgi:hypothetical protein